ncbi:MAG: type II toxin-antitoxin system RelE/ParE family toxin [Defluviitaleaceae bacterium]|nr:type II toxin-antitoxin system RelE/ParE family toxin [Defluviitaleaceae bacterium]
MTRSFISAQIFDKRWAEFGLGDEDLRKLQNFLMKKSNAGDIIQGTGGLRKLRWRLPNTGKSGGIRVLYIDFIRQEKIMLANCYAKSEKDNITDKEKDMYREFVKMIGKELEE